MRRFFVLGLVGFGLALLLPASEALALTKCRMNFELRGWTLGADFGGFTIKKK